MHAKGLEDTAFYRYNVLISLNEVGGDPAAIGVTVEEFHRQNRARLADWPLELVATSTHDAKLGGGTGRTFDWSLLARLPRSKPFFLAGGLTPDNVSDAIRAVRPDAIDVATGVESAPGVKDHAKLRKLFAKVHET